MSEFEKYLPKTSQKPYDNTIRINVFGSNSSDKKPGPDYRLVYGEDIGKGTAYDKPGVRSYNMNVENSYGDISYTGMRRDYEYQIPPEDYGKPPVLQRGNFVYSEKTDTMGIGFGFNTTSLPSFQQTTLGSKDYMLRTFGKNSNEYKEFEKHTIFTLADMARIWASEGNYNKDIIPTAGKVGNTEALSNSLKQLSKDIPSDETMFDQYSLGNNPVKVICRDSSIALTRIGESLGFSGISGTIEVGVSHAFSILHSKETGEYYGISADSVGGATKIFQGHSLRDIRESYGKHLISLGRAQHFGGVFLDDNGKVIGKWQSDIEKRRSKDFLGGDTPSRLLSQSIGTDISLNKGNIGGIDYTSLIAQKGTSIEGTTIDTDLFFRGGITRMTYGEGGASAFDVGIGTKISTKPIEISSGFTARAYVAADVNMSIGNSSEKGTQVPYLSGNSVIGGQLRYEDKKWIFTTDFGKTYELSGPNQMQRPLMKLLPSGEYAIFTGEYKGESMNILGKAVFENYFTGQRKELSLGIRTNSGYEGAIYQRNDKLNIPGFPSEGEKQTGIGISGNITKNVRWNLEGGRTNRSQGTGSSFTAGIKATF